MAGPLFFKQQRRVRFPHGLLNNDYKRLNAHLGRLPQMREEIKELRKRIVLLEEKLPRK